jgi:hypothetical protein
MLAKDDETIDENSTRWEKLMGDDIMMKVCFFHQLSVLNISQVFLISHQLSFSH